MLVITTTVGMVDGVHSHTTSAGPVVPLSFVFVVRTSSLEEGLVDPPASRHNPNSCPCAARNGFLRPTRQTYAGLVLIRRVPNDGCVVPGRPCESATVADLLLDVADDGTFWELADGDDVADSEGCFFAAVDEGAGVEALGCDEGFLAEFVAVGVAEDDAGEGCAAAGVVDDVFDDSADVAVGFCVVECAEAGGGFVEMGVGFEDCV